MSPVDPDQQNIWITVIYGDFDCCKYSSDSEGDLFSAAGSGASLFNASRSCAYPERRIPGQTYQAGHVDHSPLHAGEGAWYRGSHFAKVLLVVVAAGNGAHARSGALLSATQPPPSATAALPQRKGDAWA